MSKIGHLDFFCMECRRDLLIPVRICYTGYIYLYTGRIGSPNLGGFFYEKKNAEMLNKKYKAYLED
jgi:hypothetical protein